MSSLDILVHVRNPESEPFIASAAFALAKRVQAYVYGIYIAPLGAVAFSTPETVVLQVHEADHLYQQALTRHTQWQALLEAHSVQGEWLVAQGDNVEVLCQAASWCDWVVAERPCLNPDAPIGWGTVSRTVFGCGAPVVVVPDTARIESMGARILIAWNHSREAMRAIRGAVPLLKAADEIVLLDGAGQPDRIGARYMPDANLGKWLQRHEISSQRREFNPKNGSGEAILEAAHDMQADLIVMGAWGHSRIAQLVLGGTTRYLFQNSDLPLFVAH